jgi:monoterpene epsilon-lactone hydrolase
MKTPYAERKIRAGLPIIRFMQGAIPLPAANWLIEQGRARLRLDPHVDREAVSANGVSCEWLIPHNSRTDRVLLYLHGGGFVFGLTPPHLHLGAYLAKKLAARLLMVDYRTAPGTPFPGALDDCVTAYHWLLDQGIRPQQIGVAGDSAGGNLTITMLMKLRDEGSLLPAAAACLSPVTDLTPRDKRREGFKDPLLSPKAVKLYNRSYLGDHDPRNPLISPVFGNLRDLPPLLIHAGEQELLSQDAIRIADLADSAGVDVQLEIYPRMFHVWQLYLSLPQAIQSLDQIAHFFNAHLALGAS